MFCSGCQVRIAGHGIDGVAHAQQAPRKYTAHFSNADEN